MPGAISVSSRVDRVTSEAKLLYCNPYQHSAISYTGRYQVKMKVQQRMLISHQDSSYTFAQWQS